MLRRLRITEYDFFRNTTAFTHTIYFLKIRRIKFRRIGTEPHADDCQIYISTPIDDAAAAVDRFSGCLDDVKAWLSSSRLD